MGHHLNPLEKEFLVRKYRSNPTVKLKEFCEANGVSDSAMRSWLKQYEEGGLEGLVRKDNEFKEVLPEGVDPSVENYKREIMKLRIENERLKKNYTVQKGENGEQVYIPLKPKISK